MKIEIYGADWCGYCKKAVELCKIKLLQYEYVDIDKTSNMRLLETRIGNKVRAVPQIFIDGQLVLGGYSGLEKELIKL
jgi:glutaredoxin 1